MSPDARANADAAGAASVPPLTPDGSPLPPSRDKLLIGRTLGQYQVLEKIGQGGMGTVFRGLDTALDRPVALKVLFCDAYLDDAKQAERFMREARSLARLTHPNLLHVYNVGSQQDCYYFAMELLEGETLSAAIRRRGRIPQQESVVWLGQILSALHYVHRHGVTHRDIKSGNIMLCMGRAVLMDFGLAKDERFTGLTSVGVVLGTPDYISPEAAEGLTAGAPTDLYSLGVVLYEALSGRVPFMGKSAMSIIRQHLDSPPPPLQDLVPDLDPALTAIVGKLLEKKPNNRYPDCAALARELLKVYTTVELSALADDANNGASVAARTSQLSDACSANASVQGVLPQETLVRPLPLANPSGATIELGSRSAAAADELTVVSQPEATIALEPAAPPQRRNWGIWLWAAAGFFGVLLLLVLFRLRHTTPGDVSTRGTENVANVPAPPRWQGQPALLKGAEGKSEKVRWLEFKAGDPDPQKWEHVVEQQQPDGTTRTLRVKHAELLKGGQSLELIHGDDTQGKP